MHTSKFFPFLKNIKLHLKDNRLLFVCPRITLRFNSFNPDNQDDTDEGILFGDDLSDNDEIRIRNRISTSKTVGKFPAPSFSPKGEHISSFHDIPSHFRVRDPFGHIIPLKDFRDRGSHNLADLFVHYPQRPAPKKVPDEHWTTGKARRKSAFATVSVRSGDGGIRVNGQPLFEFFPQLADRARIVEPILATGLFRAVEIKASVEGGGPSGKSGAVAVGIAKAIRKRSPELWAQLVEKSCPVRKVRNGDRELKDVQLLAMNDPRVKECKKLGKKRARKSRRYVRR